MSLPRIRSSVRAFARAPGLSFVLLLTIALGVGSNAAVYGFLQGLTHPASPLRNTDHIVSIFQQDRSGEAGPLSPVDYQLLQNSRAIFQWLGAVRIKPASAVINRHSQIATVAVVTSNLSAALDLPLANGAVISHRLAATDFDSGQNAVGSPIHLENADSRIAGIAPALLDGLYSDQIVDLWIQATQQDFEANPNRRDLWPLARLRPGVSIPQAQAALRSASAGLDDITLAPFTGLAPNTAHGLARVAIFLNFSAAAVFFIASINVASFLLGRALKRSHETSLRIALGATRAELLQELFCDSLVLSIAGGFLGLLLGIGTARALPALLFAQDAERLTFAPHPLPILTASGFCITITILCGMMPVLGTVTDRPWTVLQRETGSPSLSIQRLRSALVVLQIAACSMLVLSTALLLAGLHSALRTSAGHRLGNPLLLTVQAPPRRDGPEIDPAYFVEVEQAAKTMPGLTPLAWTARLPGSPPMWRTFRIQPLSTQAREVALDIAWLTPGSLQSLDPQPVAGRMFGLADRFRKVAVVDQEAAAKLFGRDSAGMVIHDSAGQPIEIIGVVRRKSEAATHRPTIYYGYLDQSSAPSPVRDARFRVSAAPPIDGVELNANFVSTGYFDALNMQLISGQAFQPDRIAQQRMAVINQEAADLYFNGKSLGAAVIDDSGARNVIVAVVRSPVFGAFEQHAEPAIYFPMAQDCPPRMTLMLKGATASRRVAADLRRRIENLRSPFPVIVQTVDTQLAQSGLAPLRIATLIGSVSAALALILSTLGLLSAQSDAERQRRRDRALRLALGAQRRHVILIVLKSAARLALIGTVTGTLLSWAFLRLLRSDLALVSSPPLQIWLIAPLVPAAVVLIASMIPARRASSISPATILRES